MKKAIALILCLVMLLACAACGQGTQNTPNPGNNPSQPANNPGSQGQGDTNPDTPKKDSISIATQYDYGTLNFISMPTYGYDPLVCVQETLWECGLDGSVTPVLAESWEWPEDDHMVVHIRKGVTFSNGNPLTADDVMFTLNLLNSTQNAYSVSRCQTTDFERTAVRDEYTLDWYLKSPTIIHYPTASQMLIVDAESYDENEAVNNPIGTGPYVVKEYVINSHTIVERRDDYWGEAPELKTITFRVLAEPSQRVNALETGLVDVAPIALSDVSYVDGLPGITVRGREGSWVYMGVNISGDGKLADPEARYAIYHAIDTQAISNMVYYGLAKPMHSPFTPAITDLTADMMDMGIYKDGYNLELAKELADKSGLTGKTLVLANNGAAELVTICEMVQNMLSAIGVNVEIRSYDAASYYDVKNDKTAYDILVSNGATATMTLGGDCFIGPMKLNKIFGIWEDWANGHGPRYGEIVEGAVNIMDDAKRAETLKELITYYIETCPTMGLVEFDSYVAVPEDLNLDNYVDRIITNYYASDFSFR